MSRVNVGRESRLLVIGVILFAATGRLAQAQRPAASRLLPENTLAYLHVADVSELINKHRETALGQIGQDKNIRSLIGHLYGSAIEAFGQVEDQIGISLDRLLALPRGQLCVALIALPSGRPAPVLLVDVGDELSTARSIVARVETILVDRGAVRSTEIWRDTTLTILADAARAERQLVHFEKERTIAIVGNLDVARQLIAWWQGNVPQGEKTLAENRAFITIMNRSRGTKDEPPQLTWFVDPMELAKAFVRGNAAAQAGLAILPALGLDGLLAAGGSMILAAEDFDTITHLHVVLGNPRAGVIEMLALRPGDTAPEPWVPADAASYTTFHWDIEKTYETFGKLYDSFRGENALADRVQRRFSDRLGIDVENQLIRMLDGRFTHLTWIEPPARVNSQVHLLAARLKDTDAFRLTLERVTQPMGERLEEKQFGGVTYYQGRPRGRRSEPTDDARQPELRRAEPCIAVVGDHLIFAGSSKLLEQVIITQSDTVWTLGGEADFKQIADRIKRHVGTTQPGLVTFSRPEKALRLLYDLLTGEDSRRVLSARADENRFFKSLHAALSDNPLPPFAQLSKYLAPAGGVLINDETGLHYTGFTLKRE